MTSKIITEIKESYESVVLDIDEVLNKVHEKSTEVEEEIKEFFKRSTENSELVTS